MESPRPPEPYSRRAAPAERRPRPAVFLDRDGTLIEHVHYLSDPRDVRLLPGTSETLRRLRRAGFACVVVTNQSAVGRGIITPDRLAEIHDEMNRQLAAEGAEVDAIYYCPDVPATDDRTAVEPESERKPGPGMLLRAAAEMGLDLAASWMVGDLISDVLAGSNAGCLGSVLLGDPGAGGLDGATCHTAADLPAAADLILATADRRGEPTR